MGGDGSFTAAADCRGRNLKRKKGKIQKIEGKMGKVAKSMLEKKIAPKVTSKRRDLRPQ